MKDFLKKLIEARKAALQKEEARFDASTDANEVRAIGETIKSLKNEIREAEAKLSELDEEEPASNVVEERGGSPMATFTQNAKAPEERSDELSSMEYRNAFAKYVRTGIWEYEQRDSAAGMVITSDVGKIIPNTIMNEVIKNLKSYGNLYNRVRKLNVKGGVEFPIEDLVPTISWITETTTASNQSVPEVKTSVSFGYHICEARIAQSLLSEVVSLSYLESEIATLLAEAFVKEFDRIIVNGSGSGQPTGILNDTRVKNANKITIGAADAPDWTKWREKLFAKIPLSYRAGGVLLMTVDTWEGLICTMKDANNRPLYSEVYDVATNTTTYRFNGKEVVLVENDLGIADFSTATTGQPYMIYFKPSDYAINSNLQIGFKRYFNDDTNKWVNKGLCIMDGKLLDVNSCYIIKK